VKKLQNRPAGVALLALTLLPAACRSAAAPPPAPVLAPGTGVVTAASASTIAAADSVARRFTAADVAFMTGMIPHHAQAIVMSAWCPSHSTRADLHALCQRITISQMDEIRMMRRWLGERGQEMPDSMATRHVMRMGGTVHEMLMPGMLTDEQLAALEKAQGSEFDYLFLTSMIGHHQGAIQMTQELFASPGSGQEETVFRFASDVIADQSAEILRMQVMLESVPR
jgi:uncharacterized protein (DUF305 family)